MEKVIVIFNRPSTMGLTGADSNGNGVTEFNLKPGVNQVPKAIWDKHESHPIVKHLIDDGTIEVPTSKNGKPMQSVDEVLKGMNVPVALDTVKKTIDKTVLEKWLKLEKRQAVRKAIQKQITELNKAPELRDREQSQEDKLKEAAGSGEGQHFTDDKE